MSVPEEIAYQCGTRSRSGKRERHKTSVPEEIAYQCGTRSRSGKNEAVLTARASPRGATSACKCRRFLRSCIGMLFLRGLMCWGGLNGVRGGGCGESEKGGLAWGMILMGFFFCVGA